MAGKLTELQARFVAEYLIDLNATQAVRRAGYQCKSDEAAAAQGSRLLSYAKVKEAIQDAMEDRAIRTNITQDRVIAELAAIAFADPGDYQRVRRGRLTLTGTEDIPKEKRRAVQGYRRTKDGPEVVLADKLKALELLGKHLGIFDKKEDTGDAGVRIVFDGKTKEWAE